MAGMRSAVLAACVGGSVVLHAGLILCGTSPVPTTASGGATSATSIGRPAGVQVRLSEIRPPPVPRPQARAVTGWAAQPAAAPAQTRMLPAELDRLEPTGAGPVATPAIPAIATSAADPDAAYLPRSQLTQAPVPQQSIDLLYPELAPAGRFRAVLTLFIDDRGVVQRVRIDEADDSGLPPVLEDAARQTFLHSPFTPGELDGRPIRSRLRIEIEYATEPLHDNPQTAAR